MPERRLGSMTTSVESPVTSSTCLATVTPSSTFSNFTRPAYSVMIGREVDQMPATKVTAVARGAQPVARVAGERSAHLDFVDAQRLDSFHFIFAQQRARLEQRRLSLGIDDISGGCAAQNPLAQRLDHL